MSVSWLNGVLVVAGFVVVPILAIEARERFYDWRALRAARQAALAAELERLRNETRR